MRPWRRRPRRWPIGCWRSMRPGPSTSPAHASPSWFAAVLCVCERAPRAPGRDHAEHEDVWACLPVSETCNAQHNPAHALHMILGKAERVMVCFSETPCEKLSAASSPIGDEWAFTEFRLSRQWSCHDR